jgi:gluconokinase
MKALGKIDDFSVASEWVGSTHYHKPNEENVKVYSELIPIFISISRALESDYDAISNGVR